MWSKFWMIEASEPFANENEKTPMIMIMVANTFSRRLTSEMSPYPTVVMVCTVQ